MKKNNRKIRPIALLMGLKLLFSFSMLAEAGPQLEHPDPLPQQESKTEIPVSQLNVRFFPESEQDRHFQEILESSQLLQRLDTQILQNFKLNAPIYFHIQHIKESQLIETEIQAASQVVILPYSFLYTLYQGLSTKYDHQSETIQEMFAATTEFYIWSEVANILLKQQKLEIKGQTSTAQDNFSTLMMLNQNAPSGDYLVDAAEAYLLIHSLLSSGNAEDVQNELESDQKRYKHILCLTIGFDHLTQTDETGLNHLSQFSLNPEQIEQCQRSYLDILQNWYQALIPVLKENNLLNYWLNQERLLEARGQN